MNSTEFNWGPVYTGTLRKVNLNKLKVEIESAFVKLLQTNMNTLIHN